MTAIDYFTGTDVVRIATGLRRGGEVVTPIWAVVVDGVPYIRSAYGPGSKWYQRVQGTRTATFVDGSRRYEATIENLDDEAVNRRVDEAYRAKYAGQGGALREVVSPRVRAYTMRVILRDAGDGAAES